jgi:hypothetical protein
VNAFAPLALAAALAENENGRQLLRGERQGRRLPPRLCQRLAHLPHLGAPPRGLTPCAPSPPPSPPKPRPAPRPPPSPAASLRSGYAHKLAGITEPPTQQRTGQNHAPRQPPHAWHRPPGNNAAYVFRQAVPGLLC